MLSASGVEKDGSHYTKKVYDNRGNVIARFISGDNTYKRAHHLLWEDENMEYPYFDYSNVLGIPPFTGHWDIHPG